MKNWKDRLPGHEPGEDSWEKIEKSLRVEEQLRRELPNLPVYEPDEACWERSIVPRLPAETRRSHWYGWAAAAAVLIVSLSGAIFLMQSSYQPDDHIADNADTTAGLLSAETPAQPSSDRQERQIASSRRSPLNGAPDTAGGVVLRDGPSSAIDKSSAIAKNVQQPNELPVLTTVKNNGIQTGTDSLRLTAANSASPHSSVAPLVTEKNATGRHRIIRVNWKTPEKPGLTLAGRPTGPETEKKNESDHLIKIKL